MRIKLSKYAKDNGISYLTAYRYFMNGDLKGIQMPSGTILIDIEDEIKINNVVTNNRVVLYARVSSSENKDNLQSQLERLRLYAIAKGYNIVNEVMEVGSGLNDNRKKLTDILTKSNEWDKIIVEHKDRFARFGLNYIKLLLKKDNKEIEIINDVMNEKEDIHNDFIFTISYFTSKLNNLKLRKMNIKLIIDNILNNKN